MFRAKLHDPTNKQKKQVHQKTQSHKGRLLESCIQCSQSFMQSNEQNYGLLRVEMLNGLRQGYSCAKFSITTLYIKLNIAFRDLPGLSSKSWQTQTAQVQLHQTPDTEIAPSQRAQHWPGHAAHNFPTNLGTRKSLHNEHNQKKGSTAKHVEWFLRACSSMDFFS